MDFGDEVLEPHEIEFLERFQALGHQAEWIPTDKYDTNGDQLPTNDFIWLDRRRIEVELKNTKAKYEPIKAHIQKAVNKAALHGVVKENFVVDLGRSQLTHKLRTQLSLYNTRVQSGHIRSLWVISEDGARLERIDLQT